MRNWKLGYDKADRLTTAVASPGGKYGYTLDPAGNLTKISQPSGAATLTYNKVNEITAAAGTAFVYDANGNLLSDGARRYAWDAENRLVGITYTSQPGKKTSFAYDGLDRRVAIATTVSGKTGTAGYLWCGPRICQSRSGTNAVNRLYYDEGETIPASKTKFYYGPDQLGAGRDVYATSPVFSMTQTYDYDPYGNATVTPATGPATDFRYAGMLYHADSGLYLTQYRAYDPRTGRWLSRDPIGEAAGVNLYGYVGNNPITLLDPLGLCGNPLQNLLAALAENPLLLPLILGTEIVGGGPEDPLADLAVAEEIAAAEGGLTAAEQLAANRAAGAAFEQAVGENLEQSGLNVGEQITIETQSGVRTRLDFLTQEPLTGEIGCIECKASPTAPLTSKQTLAFPEIGQSGGTIVGAGKPGFPGGLRLPPTTVRIIRGP